MDQSARIFREVATATLAVRSRRQFFEWTQTELQRLVAHDVLFAALTHRPGEYRVAPFSCLPQAEDWLRLACDPPTGLLERLVGAWCEAGQPLYWPDPAGTSRGQAGSGAWGATADDPGSETRGAAGWMAGAPDWAAQATPAALELLAQLGSLAAHGLAGAGRAPLSFFCFARLSGPVPPESLELLVPHLHTALARVFAAEPGGFARVSLSLLRLTARERQVLAAVRAGRRNAEIGRAMGVSPLTVKNHLQQILKKLDAHRRGDAVKKALALGLLSDDDATP